MNEVRVYLSFYVLFHLDMVACCTFGFPAHFQGNDSHHIAEVDSCNFENVLENQLIHRIDCMKSMESNLTSHRVLHCDESK